MVPSGHPAIIGAQFPGRSRPVGPPRCDLLLELPEITELFRHFPLRLADHWALPMCVQPACACLSAWRSPTRESSGPASAITQSKVRGIIGTLIPCFNLKGPKFAWLNGCHHRPAERPKQTGNGVNCADQNSLLDVGKYAIEFIQRVVINH